MSDHTDIQDFQELKDGGSLHGGLNWRKPKIHPNQMQEKNPKDFMMQLTLVLSSKLVLCIVSHKWSGQIINCVVNEANNFQINHVLDMNSFLFLNVPVHMYFHTYLS